MELLWKGVKRFMSKEKEKDKHSWWNKIVKLKIPSLTFLIGFIIFYSALIGMRVLVADSISFIPQNLHSALWICFCAIIILALFILFGGGFKSFFFEKEVLTSKRHILLCTISVSIIVNYWTMGRHLVFLKGDILSDMFDMVFYLSILLFILFLTIYLFSQCKAKNEQYNTEEVSLLFTDDPIQKMDQDVLNRGNFAQKLIEPIIKSNGKLTIGIYGPWGSGKSSLFTMMNDAMPKEQVTMNFTPWYFGEKTDGIILEFLETFADQIKKSNFHDTALEKELATYASFFKSLQLRSNGVTLPIGDLLKGFLPKESDIKTVKKTIDNMLVKFDKKIVIFIDDLDRLDREEIITVFKLIRLICDFPNVIYVLALDEEIVSLALGQVYGQQGTEEQQKLKGRAYLEKFIQIPIYLPKVDESQLKNVLIDGLEAILKEHNIKTGFIEDINSTIYPTINMSIFGTIRNIKRYLNLVQIFVPILKKEVFVDDLLYLLVLKVTSPGLYDWIRMHPHILYEEDQKYFKENEEMEAFKKKYSKYRLLIEKLFPAMGYAFGNSIRKKEQQDLPNNQLAISNKIYFSKYFMYATPEHQISQENLQNFYSILSKNKEEGLEEFNKICTLFSVDDIFAKLNNDIFIQNDETILNLIDLLKNKYIESLEYKIQDKIEKYIYINYTEKRNLVLNSSLLNEPYALLLLIYLRNNIKVQRNDSEDAIEQIEKVINKIFKESSLEKILQTLPSNKQYKVFDYFIHIKDSSTLRKKKFTEYITNISRFKEIVNYHLDGKMDDLIFYQKILGDIESETIQKYISELEQDKETTEFKVGGKIKNGMKQAIPYIIDELSEALAHSQKQNIKFQMNLDFQNLQDLFLDAGIASEKQRENIENILKQAEQHNKSLENKKF